MKKLTKMFAALLAVCMLLSMMCLGAMAEEAEEIVRYDCDCSEHTHDETCYNELGELICGKKEFHVHTSACFEKVNGKAWPNASVYHTLTCGKENAGHSYSCLTEEAKAALIAAYPSYTRTVPEYEDPYIFCEVQTYLISGYAYRNPDNKDLARPQLFMLANMQGMEAGETWSYEGGKRFALGESNYTVAYCCDLNTPVVRYTMYRQINLEDANYYDNDTAKIIRSVMLNCYPYLSIEEMTARLGDAGFDCTDIDETILLAASQFAVWAFANSNDESSIDAYEYWYTYASGYYPALTTDWELGDGKTYRPEKAALMEQIADYLIQYAKENPVEAPKGQIVVSQVEVANLIMTPDDNGTYTVDLQVMLNTAYETHEQTNITITATAGDATAEIQADGSSVYSLQLKGYAEGEDITVSMSGTQYLEAGVYFYEPYAPDGNVREVSQNLVGLNVGTVPVGDTVVLDGQKLASTSLEVKKVDESGEALSGAEFELSYVSPEEETTVLGTYAVDENGMLTIDGLMTGKTYQLVESKAPDGYDAIVDPIVFTVEENEDGTLTLLFNLPEGVSYVTLADGSSILEVINTVQIEIPETEIPLGPPQTGDAITAVIMAALGSLMGVCILPKRKETK